MLKTMMSGSSTNKLIHTGGDSTINKSVHGDGDNEIIVTNLCKTIKSKNAVKSWELETEFLTSGVKLALATLTQAFI